MILTNMKNIILAVTRYSLLAVCVSGNKASSLFPKFKIILTFNFDLHFPLLLQYKRCKFKI